MNIFIRELKANRKAFIIWSICMVLLVVSGMGKYTAYSSGGASSDVFTKLPFTMKVLLGIGSFDVTTISGFFTVLFPYLEITTAIHAVLLGCGIIGKEERDKTTEFLIAKPVSRKTIITAKLLAALFNIILINLITLVTSIAMVSSFNKGEPITSEIIAFLFSMLLVQLIFFSLGTLLSAILRKPKASGSIATSILLGSFAISKVTDMTQNLDVLNVLSPFKYFSYEDIVYESSLNIGIVLLSFLLVIVFIVSTYFFYQRRDLNI